MQTPRANSGGYTLIELLVVIALIAVLTAAVGLGLRGAGDASALDASGGLVRAQLDLARARATLHGRPTALAVFAEPGETDRYLREVGIVEQDETGAWIATDDPVPMPGEVRLLPPNQGGTLWDGPFPVEWNPSAAVACYLVRFNANGTLLETSGGELWWSADPEATARGGLVMSRYGTVVPIEESATPAEAAP